jgi:hypothetical protein
VGEQPPTSKTPLPCGRVKRSGGGSVQNPGTELHKRHFKSASLTRPFSMLLRSQQKFARGGAHPRALRGRPNADFNEDKELDIPTTRWSTNKEGLMSDRATTILRCVFPCNKSSSKQLIVALDPGMHFLPTVTLCKPGARGVRMSHKAWTELMQNREILTRFFKSSGNADTTGQGPVFRLDNFVSVELPITVGEDNVATLVYGTASTASRSSVGFKDTTWQHIVSLEPLVTHLLEVYATYTPAVVKIFNDTVHFVYRDLEYVRGRETQEVLSAITVSLRKINQDDFHNPDVDSFRVIEEFKLFCGKFLLDACIATEER